MQKNKNPGYYIVLVLPFIVILSATLTSRLQIEHHPDSSSDTFEKLDTVVEHLKLYDEEKAKTILDTNIDFHIDFPKDDWQANNKVLLVEAGVMLLFRHAALTRKHTDPSTSLLVPPF